MPSRRDEAISCGLRFKPKTTAMNTPPGYEKKFAGFIKLCAETKVKGINEIVVGYPWVLGDNYEELVESLSRLADAGLSLHIASRENWPGRN